VNLSVLIPWRSEEPARVRAWKFNRSRWSRLEPLIEVCVAGDGRTEGTFSVARAVNRARKQATGDQLVIFGADHLPPTYERINWIIKRLQRHPWTQVYSATRVINEAGTERVLGPQRMAPETAAELRFDWVGCCYGILALRADVFDDVGGMDERFEGWGAEDTALRVALQALYPAGCGVGEGEAITFWHPDAPRGQQTQDNVARYYEYETAAKAGRMREYLKEARA